MIRDKLNLSAQGKGVYFVFAFKKIVNFNTKLDFKYNKIKGKEFSKINRKISLNKVEIHFKFKFFLR